MDDWQNTVTTLAQRAKFILDQKILCDCSFLIEEEEIKCHKLILAIASPVFNAMFYGGLSQEKDFIKITDIKPSIFKNMLAYIYEDKVEINSFKHACSLYNAAKKYILLNLEEECVSYLIKHLDKDNVIQIYEFAKFHNEEILGKHCLKEIQVNTSNILKSESICLATESTLSTLLDCNRLNIASELELISAIEKWANHPSRRKEQNSTEPRSISTDLVKKLRLLTVSKNEFINGIAESELLSDSEKLAVLIRIITNGADLPPMENGLCEKKIKRKPCKAKSISTLDIQDLSEARCDGSEWLTSIFVTNSRIDLLGVEINLQVNEIDEKYTENLMVKVGLAHKQDYFTEGSLYRIVPYNGKAEVMFNKIVTLEPFTEYAIHIFLCSAGIYPIGRNSSLTCTNMNVEIDFISHSSWEGSHPWNTTVLSSIIYTDPL